MKLYYYIERLPKINSSLKSFQILFLDCFLTDNDINKRKVEKEIINIEKGKKYIKND
jgi:hypothetical protein